MPVNVPQSQKKSTGLGQIGQIGGAVAGGLMAGPGGAMAGAATGAGIGGMAGGIVDGQMSKPQAANGAIERRAMIQGPQAADPQAQIAESQQALAQLPPAQQKEYGPILRRAQAMGATA